MEYFGEYDILKNISDNLDLIIMDHIYQNALVTVMINAGKYKINKKYF